MAMAVTGTIGSVVLSLCKGPRFETPRFSGTLPCCGAAVAALLRRLLLELGSDLLELSLSSAAEASARANAAAIPVSASEGCALSQLA